MSRMTMWRRRTDRGLRWLAGLTLVVGVGLVSPGPAWPQVADSAGRRPGDRSCPGGVVGALGITRVDCRGDCFLTVDRREQSMVWSFSVEPRITEIAPNGPAAGALEIGDRIVAIDGVLITTPEGGRRLANIEPDRDVTIRFRRGRRIGEATLRAGTRCGPAVEGVRSGLVSSSSVDSGGVSWTGPGIRIETSGSGESRRTSITVPGARMSVGETGVPEMSEARLGMSFGCGPCSSTRRNGRTVWSFSNPIDVIRVDVGGPAERGGIRVGDRITHVDGLRIDSRRGGEAFSTLRPGQATRLTVTGRDGIERTVTVVPSS
ncbi:MAG: PDZ domain-containing protein [Chloroflexota bacterium]